MSKRNKYYLKKAECTCDECTKPFILYVNKSSWAYKCRENSHPMYFCSYTCMREFLTRKNEMKEQENSDERNY